MTYKVQNLRLHRSITVPAGGAAPDGTISILEYRSLAEKNDLEPAPEAHLAGGTRADTIPAGDYLFTQGMADGSGLDAEKEWRDASEAVWLEALWQEAEFKSDRILVRLLSEDSKTVFQIFREIVKKAE